MVNMTIISQDVAVIILYIAFSIIIINNFEIQIHATFYFDWLAVFYSISTLVGYLMPNPVYIY